MTSQGNSNRLSAFTRMLMEFVQWILILSGIILFFIASNIKFWYSQNTPHWVGPVSEVLIGIGGALITTGTLTLLVEKRLEKRRLEHFEETIQSTADQIKTEVEGLLSAKLNEHKINMAELHVDEVINKHLVILEKLKQHDFAREVDKTEVIPIMERDHLENSPYKFEKLVERLIDCKDKEPILIYGTTLSFLSRGRNKQAFLEALTAGVHFKFALADVIRYDWNTKDQLEIKNKSKHSLDIIGDIIKNDIRISEATKPNWGSIDLRTTQLIATNSFSTFKFEKERVSVFEFNIDIHGRPDNPRYSQIFKHEASLNNNLPGRLVGLYTDLYEKSIHALTFPIKNYIIYIYALEPTPGNDKIVFIKKNGKWELPTCTVESDKVISKTARDKFQEQTGYDILFLRTFNVIEPYKSQNILIFIGKVTALKNKLPNNNVQGFYFDDTPTHLANEMLGADGREGLRRICEHP